MGILGKLFNNKEDNNPVQNPSGGTYIVEDTFKPNDLVVVGQIKGTVRDTDKVYIEGANENSLISIIELDIFRTKVESATDTTVALVLENGNQYGITKGTVLHVKA